jgi:bacteriocin biosynthesis cyclodehydratase domain-containing protein
LTSFAIIARGEFGIEVAARLRRITNAVRTAAPAEAFDSGAAVVIVALQREDRGLLARCDELAFTRAARFLPVIIEPGWLRCGPLIDPRAGGPCYQCFVVRRHQRGVEDELSDALHADSVASQHPADGYLPLHAELAARLVCRVCRELSMPHSNAAGEVLECALDRLELRSARLIGVAGCPRCAPPWPMRAEQFLRDVRLLMPHDETNVA